MSVRLVALAWDAADPHRLAWFWAELLDRAVTEDTDGLLLPGTPTQPGLRYVRSGAPRPEAQRTHLHLTSATDDDQQRTVARALDLGATHLDVGQRPEDGHIVLADPEGNAFCVIEAGNAYLAGCGFLGEFAGDGSREVGLFWSTVLGWPLVWDQDGETAIQSPDGGTKIAWGGPPVAPVEIGTRAQRFELAVVGVTIEAEVDRLLALGACRSDDGALTDPDGQPFLLRA